MVFASYCSHFVPAFVEERVPEASASEADAVLTYAGFVIPCYSLAIA
jgi:hypothetical protein